MSVGQSDSGAVDSHNIFPDDGGLLERRRVPEKMIDPLLLNPLNATAFGFLGLQLGALEFLLQLHLPPFTPLVSMFDALTVRQFSLVHDLDRDVTELALKVCSLAVRP